MKRNPNLVPLSWDHHHALVKAAMLRDLGTEKSTVTIEVAVQQLMIFWFEELLPHLREEEEILLPTFARFTDIKRPEFNQIFNEHLLIRIKIEDIIAQCEANTQPSLSALHDLGTLLHDHVRYEENHLFPAIENEVPELALAGIKSRFKERRKN